MFAEAAAEVEGAGEGVVAGMFAGLADGEAAFGFSGNSGAGNHRWVSARWRRPDGKRCGITFESPRSAVRAGPVDRRERESSGDVGTESMTVGPVPAGATVVSAAAGEGIEERGPGERAIPGERSRW